MESTLRIKVTLGEDTRRISLPLGSDWAQLRAILASRFDIAAAIPLSLKWTDEDGDLITIADDCDLREALSFVPPHQTLRLYLSTAPKAAAEPSDAISALRSLNSALQLEASEETLKELAQGLSTAAPFLKELLASQQQQKQHRACFFPFPGFGGFPCGQRQQRREQKEDDGLVRHWGITCDKTGMHPIVGMRYKKSGEDYDLCEAEFAKLSAEEQQLYERIEKPLVQHWGVTCDNTGMHPIVGVRFNKKGEDYDLCEAEFNKLSAEEQQLYERIETPRKRITRCGPRRGGCGPCGPQSSKPLIQEGEDFPAAPLDFGARGPGVAQLQKQFIELGLLHPAAIRCGVGFYGPFTRRAVAELQEALGMEVTGTFDDKVRTHLVEQLASMRGQVVAAPEEKVAEEKVAEEKVAEEKVAEDEVVEVEIPVEVEEKVVEEEPVPVSDAQVEADERAALLIAMGFSEQEVSGALEATKGSLERAADWLFVARAEAHEEQEEDQEIFPAEWEGFVEDLKEMGFEEEKAREALKQVDGQLKDAIKALVVAERGA